MRRRSPVAIGFRGVLQRKGEVEDSAGLMMRSQMSPISSGRDQRSRVRPPCGCTLDKNSSSPGSCTL